MVWQLVPKISNTGRKKVEGAMWVTTVRHNLGLAEENLKLFQGLGSEKKRKKLEKCQKIKEERVFKKDSKRLKRAKVLKDRQRQMKKRSYEPGMGD